MDHVTEAIKMLGGTLKAAKAMGVSPPAVSHWIEQGYIPPARVPLMSALTGKPYHQLNTIFPLRETA